MCCSVVLWPCSDSTCSFHTALLLVYHTCFVLHCILWPCIDSMAVFLSYLNVLLHYTFLRKQNCIIISLQYVLHCFCTGRAAGMLVALSCVLFLHYGYAVLLNYGLAICAALWIPCSIAPSATTVLLVWLAWPCIRMHYRFP